MLPRTFRPIWARRVLYPLAAGVIAAMVLGAVILPGEGPLGYRPVDRAAIVVLGLIIAYVMHRLADVRIVCTEDGVIVVNILRSRRLDWAEILAVRLVPGDPWLVLDLSDGTSVAAMGIQGSDGKAARADADALAQLVVERTRTERND